MVTAGAQRSDWRRRGEDRLHEAQRCLDTVAQCCHVIASTAAEQALKNVVPVGRYAVHLVFPTHQTGIYTFTWLRTLCPCSHCQQALGERHPLWLLPVAEQQRLQTPLAPQGASSA